MSFLSALLSLVGFFVVSVVGLYVLIQYIANFQPGLKKLSRDVKKMGRTLEAERETLIPFDREEMNLLSFNQVDQSRKKGVVTTHTGVLTTIYHEPVISYSYRKYPGNPVSAVLCAQTKTHEFVYILKKGKVFMEVDGSPLGELRDQSRLYGARNQQLLARIEREASDELLPVTILNREVGRLAKPSQSAHSNTRAFQVLGQMEDEERLILLSLTILEAVSAHVENK